MNLGGLKIKKLAEEINLGRFKSPKSMSLGGWMDEWVDVKAVLRIAYSNKKLDLFCYKLSFIRYG